MKLHWLLFLLLIHPWPAHGQETFVCARATFHDADTARCSDGLRVRFWGVDAAELRQPGGKEALQALQSLTGRFPDLVCIPRGSDRYGRVTAICSHNGTDLERWLVRNGWAHDYSKYSKGRYAPEQAEAQNARRGLWAHQAPVAPWIWRAERRR